MNETLHCLVNMPNSYVKQTLCIIPNTEERLKYWEDIAKGTFFIINRQYSIGASIRMQNSRLPKKL